MSDSAPHLPARPSLEQLQKQAKELLRQYRAGESAAIARFQAVRQPAPRPPGLADAQFVLAREHGFATWAKLKQHVETLRPSGLDQFEQLANDLAAAYSSGDKAAIREINWQSGTSFTWDHDPVVMQRRLPTWFAAATRTPDLALADARRIVAHSYGFESWAEFAASASQAPRDPRSAPIFLSSTPPFYKIDWKQNTISVRGPQSPKDWNTIFGVMREHRIARLNAGVLSDAAVKSLAQFDFVTHLHIGGTKEFTDSGAEHLARMPQLEELELGGWTSPLTDRALRALRHLTALKQFKSCWTQGISDAGLANLAFCDLLEEVDLMGTPAGDGTLQALAGKRHLRQLKTGRGVTDAGLPLLHQFPVFKTWHGGEVQISLMTFAAEPNHLLIDGPFTDAGLRALAGLEGLFGLGFFWHCPGFTSAGLDPLKHLPNLGFLGCQDEHCDDEAMRHIAAIPKLRMLMGQGAVAGDAGWQALSRSATIEYIWGRECPNLTDRGFSALAAMPSLRGIAVSCKKVDDGALSALPRFPALRQLVPMDVSDEGFRHVGGCEHLEDLWCMYCQETGDAATEHLRGLSRLKTYYAGKTRITDRSLEILARLDSLERVEFWECGGITDAGIAHLAALPRLRELNLDGLSGVTRAAAAFFPHHVRVNYS